MSEDRERKRAMWQAIHRRTAVHWADCARRRSRRLTARGRALDSVHRSAASSICRGVQDRARWHAPSRAHRQQPEPARALRRCVVSAAARVSRPKNAARWAKRCLRPALLVQGLPEFVIRAAGWGMVGRRRASSREGVPVRRFSAGIAPSVGSQGDAFDNALAESVIGLYKTEVIRRRGPWRSSVDEVLGLFRYTSIIGDGLRARSPSGQGSEAVLACHVLNRMRDLGRPASYAIRR